MQRGRDARVATAELLEAFAREAQHPRVLLDVTVGRVLSLEEAHLSDALAALVVPEGHLSLLPAHPGADLSADHHVEPAPGLSGVKDPLTGGCVDQAAHQRDDPGLGGGESVEDLDRAMRLRAEIQGEQVPERHDPHPAAQGRSQHHVRHPGERQGKGGEHTQLDLGAKLGEGETQEARAERGGGVGHRAADGRERRRGGALLVAESLGVAEEANEVVNGVVDGDPDDHRRDQAGARVQADAAPAQRAEVGRDRNHVRHQGDQPDANREEEQRQDHVDDAEGGHHRERLAADDPVQSPVEDHGGAGHPTLQPLRERGEPLFDPPGELLDLVRVDHARPDLDGRDLVAGLHEAAQLGTGAEEQELTHQLAALRDDELIRVVLVEAAVEELHVVGERGGAADLRLRLQPGLERLDLLQVGGLQERVPGVGLEDDEEGVRPLQVLVHRLEVDPHRSVRRELADLLGADADPGSAKQGQREERGEDPEDERPTGEIEVRDTRDEPFEAARRRAEAGAEREGAPGPPA